MLEEVSNLANRLRTQALEGREDTLELAKRVNDFQAKIKGTTRKMMSTGACTRLPLLALLARMSHATK